MSVAASILFARLDQRRPAPRRAGRRRSHAQARLCFYGPPGTGKTAFGHWLAQELGKTLMVKRVSDLVSPYVGTTEQNLAQAFDRAQQEDAVLLLDEVDSFLQDRRKARQSWEVTAVNEMLTQMESYRGLFIASTNLMSDLDEASLRRFDLKVHFGYLKAAQVQHCFAPTSRHWRSRTRKTLLQRACVGKPA